MEKKIIILEIKIKLQSSQGVRGSMKRGDKRMKVEPVKSKKELEGV